MLVLGVDFRCQFWVSIRLSISVPILNADFGADFGWRFWLAILGADITFAMLRCDGVLRYGD